jgi:Family of unknown function (DUF6788)
MPRTLRPYHYLRIAEQVRDNPHLVRELVRCGKPACGCATEVRRRHGPYWYLRTFPNVSWRACGGGSGAPGPPMGARS